MLTALIHQETSGEGRGVSVAIHEAVSKNPEQDIMYWVMRRVPLWRMTNRHAREFPNHSPGICHTKDGRWYMTPRMGARDPKNPAPMLTKYGPPAPPPPPPPHPHLRAPHAPPPP